jgi:hemerythrin
VDYTTSHFGTEEKYFFKLDYPEKASHQKEHSAFVQKIGGFKADFEKGKVTLSIDVMHFLSDWLRNHIKGTDKKYARFFNERGVF